MSVSVVPGEWSNVGEGQHWKEGGEEGEDW